MRLLLLVLLSACGSDSSSSGTYAAKCQVACVPQGACAGQDASQCKSACVAATEGLTAVCAQCIADHSGFIYTKCENGTCLVTYEPGDTGHQCGGGTTCNSSQDSCDGIRTGKTSDCTTECAAP